MDSSKYQPPVRRSLSNEELETRINQAMASHSGVEAAMELLVTQEALRSEEDKAEAAWVASMEAEGSAEALEALGRFRNPASQPVSSEITPPVQQAPSYEPPVQESDPEVVEPAVPEPVEPKQPTFSWLNPAPPTPVEPVVPIQEPEPISEVEPEQEEYIQAAEPQVQETEATVFSWFTESPEPESSGEEVETQTDAVLPEPVGAESESEFEKLLAAAAAEEELTALEELESKPVEYRPIAESNVVIPTDENRTSGPWYQLLAWLGLSSTVVPVLITWALIGMGLNISALIVALSVGYLFSGLLISAAAIAGKRSGLSTGIIARSIYGVWGNSIPLSVMVIVRLAIGAVLVSVLTLLFNGMNTGIPNFNDSVANVSGIQITNGFLCQAGILIFVTAVAFARGTLSRIINLLLSLLAFGWAVQSIVFFQMQGNDFQVSGSSEIISLDTLSAAAVVVMVNLVLWLTVSSNLAKSVPMKVRGVKIFSAVFVANTLLPIAVGIGAVSWLSTVSSDLGYFKVADLQEASLTLPNWAQGALASGIVIALLFASIVTFKTSTLSLLALFGFKRRTPGALIALVATLGLLALFTQQPAAQNVEYLVNVFVLVAAFSAGWLGIFVADVSIRRQAYHELSLSRSYGLYKKFNILALAIWIFTVVAAVAVVPVNLQGMDFMGFALEPMGLESSLQNAALGFVAVVVLGMLLTYAIRIPQIKKQEREVLALESRREQLIDIFVGAE